ncbi:MAG: hypothetical protein IT372_37005 [Polyangiaceae bacterium]|nr:hypothetical protein [Polyangiaceae bacterium]
MRALTDRGFEGQRGGVRAALSWIAAGLCAAAMAALPACGDDGVGIDGSTTTGAGAGPSCTPYLETDGAKECRPECDLSIPGQGTAARYCTVECDQNGGCPDLHQCIATAAARTCVLLCAGGCPTGMSCGGSFCTPAPPQ